MKLTNEQKQKLTENFLSWGEKETREGIQIYRKNKENSLKTLYWWLDEIAQLEEKTLEQRQYSAQEIQEKECNCGSGLPESVCKNGSDKPERIEELDPIDIYTGDILANKINEIINKLNNN